MAPALARLQLLRAHRAFTRLVAAITISSLGDPLTQIAALVTIYAFTGSALAVAGAFIIQALAALLMTTLFGGTADRFNRRSLVVNLGLLRALLLFCAPALLFATPFLPFPSIWLILPLLFVLAFINAIVTPAQQSAVPALVPEGAIGPANSIVFGATWIAQAAGALLAAGVLLAWPLTHLVWPATTGLFLLDGASFLIAALLVRPLPSLGGGDSTIRVHAALHTTFSFLATRSHLFLAAPASFVLGLAFPTFIVLAYRLAPPTQGPVAYAWLEAVTSISLFVGALLLGRFLHIGSHRTAAFGLALCGAFSLPIVLLGLLTPGWLPFLLALGLLCVAAIGNPIYSVANSTALLEAAPEDHRGSVMATRFGLTQTGSLLGIAAAGLTNSLFGPFVTFALMACGLLILAGYARFLAART
jgi:MFS family permease